MLNTPLNIQQMAFALTSATGQGKGTENNRGPATDPTQWSQQKLFAEGTYSLRYGRRLENAILYFTELAKREPQNARWKTLLACAQAQRAYTITRAMEDVKTYVTPEEHYRRWEEDRKKIYSLQNTPIPPPPPVPRTQDDNQLFTEKPELAAARIKELSLGAIALLESATKLAARESPQVQAELTHLRGWALLALWSDPRRSVPDSWSKTNDKQDGPERIVEALEQAVKLQPDNPLYLQSLSDGCILAAGDPVRAPFLFPPRFNEALYNRGRDALREHLSQSPRKAEYWFRLGYLEAKGDFSALTAKLYPTPLFTDNASPPQSLLSSKRTTPAQGTDVKMFSPEGIRAVEHAAATDPANALYHYVLAAMRLGANDKTGMVEAMERGNAAGPLLPTRYPYAAPSVFTWLFSEQDWGGVRPVRFLGKGVSDMRREKDAYKPGSLFRRAIDALRGVDDKFKAALANPGISANDREIFLSHEVSFSMTLSLYSPNDKETNPTP